jgi:hypothetical protein
MARRQSIRTHPFDLIYLLQLQHPLEAIGPCGRSGLFVCDGSHVRESTAGREVQGKKQQEKKKGIRGLKDEGLDAHLGEGGAGVVWGCQSS